MKAAQSTRVTRSGCRSANLRRIALTLRCRSRKSCRQVLTRTSCRSPVRLEEQIEVRLERRGIQDVVRREVEDDDLVIGPEGHLHHLQTLVRVTPEAGGDVAAREGLVGTAQEDVGVADDQARCPRT